MLTRVSISPFLWKLAADRLSERDRRALEFDVDKITLLDDIVRRTREKQQICIQKQWVFKWKGKKLVLRDVAEKIVAWVNRYKAIGDIAAQFDPVHAALPWAGFRFLLQVSPKFAALRCLQILMLGSRSLPIIVR